MLQIIYTSVASRPYTLLQLRQLLSVARAKNEMLEVSGMLLYHKGFFLQVLEGPADALDSLFERIKKDANHTKITLLCRDAIEEKEFKNWSMEFVDPEKASSVLQGYLKYEEISGTFSTDKTRAKKALHRFQEGIWQNAR